MPDMDRHEKGFARRAMPTPPSEARRDLAPPIAADRLPANFRRGPIRRPWCLPTGQVRAGRGTRSRRTRQPENPARRSQRSRRAGRDGTMRFAAVIPALAIASSEALAHDWYTGTNDPVTGFRCCGATDCAPIPDIDVKENAGRLTIRTSPLASLSRTFEFSIATIGGSTDASSSIGLPQPGSWQFQKGRHPLFLRAAAGYCNEGAGVKVTIALVGLSSSWRSAGLL